MKSSKHVETCFVRANNDFDDKLTAFWMKNNFWTKISKNGHCDKGGDPNKRWGLADLLVTYMKNNGEGGKFFDLYVKNKGRVSKFLKLNTS